MLAYGALAMLALLLAGATLLIVAPPTDLIRDRLIAEVKARWGRDLSIKGGAELTFVPALGVRLKGVTLSAPAGMTGPPLIEADGLEVQVALLPLVSRNVSVERLVLRRPVIELRVDGQGRRSWDFAAAGSLPQPGLLRYAQVATRGADGQKLPAELQDFVKNASPANTAAKVKLGGAGGLSFGDVHVAEGTIKYADARKGVQHEVKGIDARLSLKEISGPLDFNGQLVLGGERVAFEARVQSLIEALEERPTRVTFKLGAKPLDFSYDGIASLGHVGGLDGRVTLKSPSLDALFRLLQVPLSGAEQLGALAIDGQVKVAGPIVGISGASFALGETSAKGNISLDSSNPRPLIKANLKFAALDLNRLAGLEPAPSAPATAVSPAGRFSPPAGRPIGPPVRSIEDLLNRPAADAPPKPSGPAIRGFTRRSGDGWSSDPISLLALRFADVDGRFEFDHIAWEQMKIGHTDAGVLLKGGVLKVEIGEVRLYGGRAKGLFSIDAREAEMTLGVNISGDGIAAMALLKDAADLDVFDGRTRFSVAVSARGGSERELIGTLAGKADLLMTDGAVHGWDVSQMLSGLGQGRIPSPERITGARTSFSELSGSFPIQHGVARNQDLKFVSPALGAVGSGVINIVDRNINLVVRPKPASMPGGIGGIEIPLRIAGPWSKVNVMVDAGGALKSQQTQDAVRQLGKQLQNGDVDGALRGVLGNDPKADEKIGKAKERLKQLFNR